MSKPPGKNSSAINFNYASDLLMVSNPDRTFDVDWCDFLLFITPWLNESVLQIWKTKNFAQRMIIN